MESSTIKNRKITASSFYRDSRYGVNLKPENARLHNDEYWAAAKGDLTDPWIQVDLMHTTIVTGIITQGSRDYYEYFDEWITHLQIEYGDSEDSLVYILENGQKKVSKKKYLKK